MLYIFCLLALNALTGSEDASSYRTGEDRKLMQLLEEKLSGKMGRKAAVGKPTASGCGYTIQCT